MLCYYVMLIWKNAGGFVERGQYKDRSKEMGVDVTNRMLLGQNRDYY